MTENNLIEEIEEFLALTANRQQFTAQEIDPSIVDPNEVGLLEDLIAAAVNDARSKVDGKVAEKMQEVSGGITLPPGFNLPF